MSFSENFIEVFNFLSEKIGIAIDWTSENVMPYLVDVSERIIHYLMVKEAFYGVSWLIAVIVFVYLSKFSIKQIKKHYKEETGLEVLFTMLLTFLCGATLTFSINFYECIMNLIQMFFLPEATLIEFITNLTNQIM